MYILRKAYRKTVNKAYLTATKKKYRSIFIISFLFVLINSYVLNKLEPNTFDNLYHATWLVMTTATTTGYGDVSTQTPLGRTWTMLILYPFGIGLFGILVGMTADLFTRRNRKREEGKMKYRGENHIVIVGWTDKSKETIKKLLKMNKKKDVLLIADLEKTPFEEENFHYIQGKATDMDILQMAKIEESEQVMIFAPDDIHDTELADGKTLLIVSSIEDYEDEVYGENGEKKAGSIYTVAEILDQKHERNFRHVHVNELVPSQTIISDIMLKTIKEKK